jgi:hypothetical protein
MAAMDTGSEGDPREQMRRLIEGARDRASLETLRRMYSNRLHRQSDDYDATAGLRLVYARLQRTPLQPPPVTTSS